MNYEKVLALFAVFWIIVCLVLAFIGGKNLRKPNPAFEKVPILIGLGVAGMFAVLVIIGTIFLD